MGDDRHIQIGGDADGNVVITGRDNVVILQTTRLLDPERPAAPPALGPNPYLGLTAFTETEADRFFGREELTQHLWRVFRDLHEAEPGQPPPLRLLPILGPSGSGKSSLARAGLIAELARRSLPGLHAPRVAVLTPGAHPVEALAGVLARLATRDPTPVAKTREFAAELRKPDRHGDYDGLRRIAEVLPEISVRPLIILIDQFEEIYSLCEEPQERDVLVHNLLLGAADRAARVSVILTLRSDFLAQSQWHPRLNHVIASQGVIVPAMRRDDLRRAIAEPAIRAGSPIDAATVDLLVSETEGREGALPLLQFALTRIWEGMAEGIEPAEKLRRIGGVGGALAGEAQRLYERLSDVDKAIARRAFLGLVRLGEGTRDTRRRIGVSDIVAHGEDPHHVHRVLDLFSRPGARLITLSANPEGTDTAEVTHEALFDHWDALKGWLDSNRTDLRFHRRLADAAAHWASQGRPDGSLWRRPDLDLLRDFHRRLGDDMTETQVAFYQASVHKEQRVQWLKRATFATVLALLGGVSYYAHSLWVESRPWGILRNLSTGSAYALSGDVVSIGRSTEHFKNRVNLRYRNISRLHVFVSRDRSMIDMRSLMGTTVNGDYVPYGDSRTLEDGDIILLAGIAPFQFESITYSPFQLWSPTIHRSSPPSAWGLVIDDRTKRFHYLTEHSHVLSLNADNQIVLDAEGPANGLLTVTRHDQPWWIFDDGRERREEIERITVRDRDDGVDLWALMKMGDYTYRACRVPPGGEHDHFEWRHLQCERIIGRDDFNEDETSYHSVYAPTYHYLSKKIHFRIVPIVPGLEVATEEAAAASEQS